MKRRTVTKRDNWQQRLDDMGFSFHSMDGLYWREGVYYEFSAAEIDAIEDTTANLHDMCLEAVKHVFRHDLLGRLGIPESCIPLVRRSWERRDCSLYGRFDFVRDAGGGIKLLEYNADTPTSLFESSIAQWVWLNDLFPGYDQFNSIHEKLAEAFGAIKTGMPAEAPLYFSCVRDHEEDLVTVEYLRDVAIQSGIDGRHIFIEELGYHAGTARFCDLDNEPIEYFFKLYPWEWLLADDFGRYLLAEPFRLILEPAWKLVLASKGILAILWELFPGHPNLLPASLTAPKGVGRLVRKPFFSREGANIAVMEGDRVLDETGGKYGMEGFVYQEYQELPLFDDQYALVGSWIVDGRPAGIGIREDTSPITRNSSTFVPHLFKP